ncbi:MAG: hypothetical protein SYC29_14780 [Planctomycetota bacterium]|nr:hypothetical protein [Planctomycetota bacterium]
MRRRILTILLFLALGAIVNVAVAWMCALAVNVYDNPTMETQIAEEYRPRAYTIVRHRVALGATALTSHRARAPDDSADTSTLDQTLYQWGYLGALAEERLFEPAPASSNTFGRISRTIDGRGLPYRSLWCEIDAGREHPVYGGWGVNAAYSWSGGMPRVLPYHPLWVGFALNTLFYGVIIWALLCGSSALRKFIRRKRGRCPKCGYDLRGKHDAGCPECGWNRPPEAASARG